MLIELSHPIEDGLITYPGLPAARLSVFQSRDERHGYDPNTSFQISGIEMVGNTATYLDAPFHRYADGWDLATLPLENLVNLEGVVIATTKRRIDRQVLTGRDLRGRAVLVATGWSQHWKTPRYFEDYPFLTSDAANYLVEEGVRLVGLDSVNVDDNSDPERPVHSQLLAHRIPIVEHLRALELLPEEGFRFFAAPPRIVGGTSFPVRAFAITDQHDNINKLR